MAALMGSVEIRTAEYRPCYVSGKKALFHRYADKERTFVKTANTNKTIYTGEDMEYVKRLYDDKGYLYPGFDVDVHRYTVAIVEYEDGTVAEVEPTAVRFVPGIMNEYNFGEAAENETCNATD